MNTQSKAKHLFNSLEPHDTPCNGTFYTRHLGLGNHSGTPVRWIAILTDWESVSTGNPSILCGTNVKTPVGPPDWALKEFDESEFIRAGAVATREELE